jgi:hypothetical protein
MEWLSLERKRIIDLMYLLLHLNFKKLRLFYIIKKRSNI